MEEDGDDDMRDLESLNYDDLDSVSKLQKTQRYKDIMQVCKPSFLSMPFFFIYILLVFYLHYTNINTVLMLFNGKWTLY